MTTNNLDIDDTNLAALREYSVSKSKEIFGSDMKSLIEIGPPRISGSQNSPIYSRNSKWFFSIEQMCRESNVEYKCIDIDPSVNPDFLGSIEDSNFLINNPKIENFDALVCFSVLEHCRNPFKAVNNIKSILKIGGYAHFLTPWDLRFHGPRPDCWRISDDGYESLLSDNFEIKKIEYLKQDKRPLSPIAIYCKARRIS